ncbi:CHAT domain-containing protein [candidate division KSB1 bacterium]|nr:CHAT domain-containing protein [candidate division KSB1 bacterium]
MRFPNFILLPLVLATVLFTLVCTDSGEQIGALRTFTVQQDWQAALQAFALDSTDTRLVQTWSRKHGEPADTLSAWLQKNYWPMQSLGLRLAEQAILQLGFASNGAAQGKLDTANAIAQDLGTACRDSLLISLSSFISTLNADTKPKRAVLTLQRLHARTLLEFNDYAGAALAYQGLRNEARAVGDAILEIHAEQGVLDVWAQQDRYEQVVAHGHTLLALAQRRGYYWAQAQTLNIIADAYRVLERDSLALLYAQQAFAIAQHLGDRLTLRDSDFYRARILYRMDHLQEAGRALQEMRRRDREAEYLPDALLLEGQLHQEQGEYGLAQMDLEQSARLFEQLPHSANSAAVYSNLSLLHVETGDYERAMSDERKAYALHESERNESRMARSAMNLGFIYAKMDSLDAAQAAYDQALVLYRASGERRGRIETLLLQGELLLKRGQLPEAEHVFHEAARDAEALGFAYGHASACLNLAKLAVQQNLFSVTDSLLMVAEQIAEKINSPTLKTLAQWQRAGLARRQAQPVLALAYLEQALAIQEKVFSSITRDSLRVSFFATVQDLFDEAITVALELGEHERALSWSERGRARALLEAWGKEFADSSGVLLEKSPSVKTLQSALPRTARVVEYRVLPKALVVWLISSQEFITLQLPITRRTLEDSTKKYLQSLGATDLPDFRQRVVTNSAAVYQDNRGRGRELYDELLLPLAPALTGGNEIYLIADGILHQLPFGALVTTQNRFVEEEYVLVKAPSLAALYQGFLAQRRTPQFANNRLLYVGNPAGDLPAAREEEASLAAHFARKKVLTQSRARFDTIATSLHEGAEIFHLSLHAVADPQRALNSYLELSRADATDLRPSLERIYARRLLEWELSQTWLVLLNGCETASGKIVRGEGALNIARLFALQRVSVVIASLWQNDDRWSVALVTAFYRHLAAGVNAQTALHLAKLEMIRKLADDASLKYPLPYFWAVFELYLNCATAPSG